MNNELVELAGLLSATDPQDTKRLSAIVNQLQKYLPPRSRIAEKLCDTIDFLNYLAEEDAQVKQTFQGNPHTKLGLAWDIVKEELEDG